MRVLLVDDEIELVSALAERLEMRGIAAEYVGSGEAAVERVLNRPFHLAVLDMKMPGVAGLDLKEKLKAARPGMKFIFMTGYGSDDLIEEILRDKDSNVYLVKPVDIEDLIRAMRSAIDGVNEEG